MTQKVVFPSFRQEMFSAAEMRQLVSALEIRFQSLEQDDYGLYSYDTNELDLRYAQIGHTHVSSEITDLNTSIFGLDDVTGTPSIGEGLIWNGTAFETTPISGGGASNLNDLTDVNAFPTDGQALVWDVTTLRWIAADPPSGGVDTLVDLTDTDLAGQLQGDLMFNADGTEWQSTGTKFQWVPDQYVQLGYQIGINWYSAAFSSVELLTFGGGTPGDLYWNSVGLYSRLNGTDGSTSSFNSDDDNAHILVPTNGAQIDTAQSKFGGSSILLDNTGAPALADYVRLNDYVGMELLGNDFTVEAWIRLASLPTTSVDGGFTIIAHYQNSGNLRGWWFKLDDSNALEFAYSTDGITVDNVCQTAFSFAVDTWYAVAAVRDGNSVYLYVDGTRIGTHAVSGSVYNQYSAFPYIGLTNTSSGFRSQFDGWIDEIRLTVGVARYTGATYTLQTDEFPTALGATEAFTVGDPAYTTTIDGTTTTVTGAAIFQSTTEHFDGSTWNVQTGISPITIDGDVGDTTTPLIDILNTGTNLDRRLIYFRETADQGFYIDGDFSLSNPNNALVVGTDIVGAVGELLWLEQTGNWRFGTDRVVYDYATRRLTMPSTDIDLGTAAFGDRINFYGSFGASNSAAIGNESTNDLFYRSQAIHRWYINQAADSGANNYLYLNVNELGLERDIDFFQADAATATHSWRSSWNSPDYDWTFTGTTDLNIIGLTGDVVIASGIDLIVGGDLTVSGTTTTINSNVVSIADNIILLNSDETVAPTQDAGLEVERGTSPNVFFQFNETNDRWEFTNDGTTYYNLMAMADGTAINNTLRWDGSNWVESSIFKHTDSTGTLEITQPASTTGGYYALSTDAPSASYVGLHNTETNQYIELAAFGSTQGTGGKNTALYWDADYSPLDISGAFGVGAETWMRFINEGPDTTKVVKVADGTRLRIEDGSETNSVDIYHDGSDLVLQKTGIASFFEVGTTDGIKVDAGTGIPGEYGVQTWSWDTNQAAWSVWFNNQSSRWLEITVAGDTYSGGSYPEHTLEFQSDVDPFVIRGIGSGNDFMRFSELSADVTDVALPDGTSLTVWDSTNVDHVRFSHNGSRFSMVGTNTNDLYFEQIPYGGIRHNASNVTWATEANNVGGLYKSQLLAWCGQNSLYTALGVAGDSHADTNIAGKTWLGFTNETDTSFEFFGFNTAHNYASMDYDGVDHSFTIRDGTHLIIEDGGETDSVDISHDGTDLVIQGTNTRNIKYKSTNSNNGGMFIWNPDQTGFQKYAVQTGDGTDWRYAEFGTTGSAGFFGKAIDSTYIYWSTTSSTPDYLNFYMFNDYGYALRIADHLTYNSVDIISDVANNPTRFGIYDSSGTDYVEMYHDGTDLKVDFTNTRLLYTDFTSPGYGGTFTHNKSQEGWVVVSAEAGDGLDYRYMEFGCTGSTGFGTGHVDMSYIYWSTSSSTPDYPNFYMLNDYGDALRIVDHLTYNSVDIISDAVNNPTRFGIYDSSGTDYMESYHDGTDFFTNYVNTNTAVFDGAFSGYVFQNTDFVEIYQVITAQQNTYSSFTNQNTLDSSRAEFGLSGSTYSYEPGNAWIVSTQPFIFDVQSVAIEPTVASRGLRIHEVTPHTDYVEIYHDGTNANYDGFNTEYHQFDSQYGIAVEGTTYAQVSTAVTSGTADYSSMIMFQVPDATNFQLGISGSTATYEAGKAWIYSVEDLVIDTPSTYIKHSNGAADPVLRMYDGTATNYAEFYHDTTDFNIDVSGTTSMNITGFTVGDPQLTVDASISLVNNGWYIDVGRDDGGISIYGGNHGTAGTANIELYGASYPSVAGEIYHDAVKHTFRDVDAVPTWLTIDDTRITANRGIRINGDISKALTGTVSVTAATAAVTGVGTVFTTECNRGCVIKIGTEVFKVASVASNTSLTLDSNHIAGASGVTAYTDADQFLLYNGENDLAFAVDTSGSVATGIYVTAADGYTGYYQDSNQADTGAYLGVANNGTGGAGGLFTYLELKVLGEDNTDQAFYAPGHILGFEADSAPLYIGDYKQDKRFLKFELDTQKYINVEDGSRLRFNDGGETDWIDLYHDGSDLVFTSSTTRLINYTYDQATWGGIFTINNNQTGQSILGVQSGDGTDYRYCEIGTTGSAGARADASHVDTSYLYYSSTGQTPDYVDFYFYNDYGDIMKFTDNLTFNSVDIISDSANNETKFRIFDKTGVDHADFYHDGTNLLLTGANTGDLQLVDVQQISMNAPAGSATYNNTYVGMYILTSGASGASYVGVHNTEGTSGYMEMGAPGSTYVGYSDSLVYLYGGTPNNVADSWHFIGSQAAGGGDEIFLDLARESDVKYLTVDQGTHLRIKDSTRADSADFYHDGTDLNTDFTGTADWNITGFSGGGGIITDGAFKISSVAPFISLVETDATVDNGTWQLFANGEVFTLQAALDGGAGNAAMTITRGTASKANPDIISFENMESGMRIRDGAFFQVFDSTNAHYFQIKESGSNSQLTTNTNNIQVSAGGGLLDLISGTALRIRDGGNTDTAVFTHNGTDFTLYFTNTTDWDIGTATNYMTGGIKVRNTGARNIHVNANAGANVVPVNVGAPANANHMIGLTSETANDTLAYGLYHHDGTRLSRSGFFSTDAATGNGEWGLAQSWSSGGNQDFRIYMGGVEKLELLQAGGNLKVPGTMTILGKEFRCDHTAPRLFLAESGSATDEGNWMLVADGGILGLRAYNDAESAYDIVFSMNRTGQTVDSVDFEVPVHTNKYFQYRTTTTTALEDITHVINTHAGKVQGAAVFNATTSKPVWAVGNADGSVWVDATGTTAHTPV